MKRARNLLLCLAGGLALNTSVRADDAVLPGNPYAPVVARNIFGLNPPPPPVDPNAAADATPPPKITPNGIMSIFGQLQVLFKVTKPAVAGKPAVDDAYILSEGQQQDEIEVTKIDERGGLVTFNNHGEVQQLPLAVGTASTGAAPAGGPAMLGNPAQTFKASPGGLPRTALNTFNGGGASPNPNGGSGYGGGNGGIGNNGMNGNGGGIGGGIGANGGINSGGLNFGNNPNRASSLIIQPSSGLTEEQQTLMIEAQRQNFKNNGDPTAALLPPTEMTPPP